MSSHSLTSDRALAILREALGNAEATKLIEAIRTEGKDGQAPSETERFDPQPLDYRRLIAEGLPLVGYLDPPYLPAGVSIWATGPTGSAKSIWALWTSCRLSRGGIRVVYLSQENPRDVELRRLERLNPDPDFLELYHYQGLDLALPEHVEWVKVTGEGAGLIVLDTLTACWSGDEEHNPAVAALDREVIRPIIEATEASVLTLDHTGHPVAFVRRRGTSAPRGASSKGQKADFFLEFRIQGDRRFLIHHDKNRVTGINEPDRTFEVVDTEEAMLDIVQVETMAPEDPSDRTAIEERILGMVADRPDHYSKSSLANAAGGNRQSALAVIEQLLVAGILGPNKDRAKLRIMGERSEQGELA